jgi:NADH-quinone oxidoreductase subunit M
MMDKYILTIIVFLPVIGALVVTLIPSARDRAIRMVALLTMIAGFILGLVLWFGFDPASANLQFSDLRLPWLNLGTNQVNYQLGVDGISLLLVELTLLLGPLVILSSWSAVTVRVKEYHFFLLLLQTGMLGALAAMDLLLFYVFWELTLVPMYFLIGVWGGERKLYAAIKFFLFTMAGSALMLVAILYLAYRPEINSFDIISITAGLTSLPLKPLIQELLLAAFAVSLAIRVPIFPFHTWLPDAHAEAPTAGSVILAGVMLQMGAYGFVRLAIPFFPYAMAQAVPIIWTLAVIGIIYGALVSMVQVDVKKLVAYSSVSQLGFVILGLFALTSSGIQGALLQMVNHGLSTGALFLLVGVIYERRHTRLISEFGGLAKVMPRFAAAFMIVTLSAIGLPGLNGFVGEFLILIGAYTSSFTHAKAFTIVAAIGIIFLACSMLWMFRRVMFGPVTRKENLALKDLNAREIVYLSALIVFIVWIGAYPSTFLSRSQVTVDNFIGQVTAGRTQAEKMILKLAAEDKAEAASEPGAP